MNADMLIESARTWERDWGERRTSGLITALTDLAVSEGKRADEAEHVVDRWMATARELKARLDTAIENCSVARAEAADHKRTLLDVAQELTKAGIAAHVNLPGLTIAYGLCDRVEQLAAQRDAALTELARLKGQQP